MRNYIDQWYSCFKKRGYETYVFDGEAGYTLEYLEHIIKGIAPDYVMCCNAIYSKSLSQLLPECSKYVTVLYDNPVFHRERLSVLGENAIVFSCDRFYTEFIQRYYPAIGEVAFLPLSGNGTSQQIPYEKREWNLLFTGSYMDINVQYQQIKNLPPNLQPLAENMIGIMVEKPMTLLWDALDQVLESCGVKMEDTDRFDLLHCLYGVDGFVRAYVRDQVMLHIVDAGFPVHIYGEGWEKFACRHPQNLLLHEGYGETSLSALGNTKISLNVMPWFRGGIQERNIAAMLSGAVSLTDSSTYLEENFTDGEDIALYSLQQLDDLPQKISSLLEDEEKGKKIAEAGYQKAIEHHTWSHRISSMMETLREKGEKG
jgi:hypothetical protein